MRYKLAIIILSLSIPAWAETLKEKVDYRISTLEQYANSYKTTLLVNFPYFNEWSDEKISDEEVSEFFQGTMIREDDRRQYNPIPSRFDRTRPQPILSPDKLKDQEQKILKLLDQCVAIIGSEPDDPYLALERKEGVYYYVPYHVANHKYFDLWQQALPSYLSGRMNKCTRYIYGFSYKLSDFEYEPTTNITVGPDLKKRKQVEKLYEEIYLQVRAAGLLEKIWNTHYPKSLLRAHADKTGLTEFIKQERARSKDRPDIQGAGFAPYHDAFAAQFFNRDKQTPRYREEWDANYNAKWISSFEDFLDQQIINKK